MKLSNRILVMAGEPSGDRAAAAVVRAMGGGDRFFGVGGDALAAEGMRLEAHIRSLTALGIGESVRRFGAWAGAWIRIRELCLAEPPAGALLVDCPDVNLPLARVLKGAGIPVFQYIAPKVWAWRRRRLHLLRARTDHVGLILPFEEEIFRRARVKASFVGHPSMEIPHLAHAAAVRTELHLAPGTPLVALLPGSRRSEVDSLSDHMIEAGMRLLREGVCSVLAPAPEARTKELEDRARSCGVLMWSQKRDVRELLGAADAGIVASGTVTLEAAVMNMPMAIVYRVGPVSAVAARLFLDIPWIGLPNWVAGAGVVPELLGHQVTGENMARQALDLLEPSCADRQRRDLVRVVERLGPPGAGVRVAGLLSDLIS